MRLANTLWGVALGDAWGAPNEFKSYTSLTAEDLRGPEFPETARVTDDTQMTLAVAQALTDTEGWFLAGRQDALASAFVAWLDDEDNTSERAPGSTCLSACEKLADGEPWYVATRVESKGCGTVMRTAPLAFDRSPQWRELTAFTSLLTHAHPVATTAALVLTATLRECIQGQGAKGLISAAQRLTSDDELFAGLEDFIEPVADDADEYWDTGRGELHAALDAASAAVRAMRDDPWGADVCDIAGQGWVAEECLGAALACVELFPDDPVTALRRAVTTGGDSDSLGAVAGSLIGAVHPTSVWPRAWLGRVETRYATWIKALTA